ncbi:unnamed protein product [Adineta steineri]|uniref:G-protein coupled receptors family 1 profile domain-containing protein n=1 Tax=Adineta steineri TaxID=433720 RepID=A0A815FXS6_9BILA|nr:unnamed protein product [Adineta steineri]CAF3844150.1 unnamed protein product [Adineta steineri]
MSNPSSLSSSSSLDLITILNGTTIATSTSIAPMPMIKLLPVALVLSTIVILCICGNILVILSVFTFRPLRTVQNFFIVSLAFSDMLVAITVMPFHIVTHILDRWIFGRIFCQIFVTCDVLLCTSSILNLCAIALDRYWAISDPIQYARQRTVRRVLFMIALVWILSATISIPPIIATIFGSDDLSNFNELQCELSNNKVYVIYSACGSFYIPAIIMTVVYAHVFIETRKRFRERAKAAQKLANATRVHKSLPMNSCIMDQFQRNLQKSLTSSSNTHRNSSLKTSASNGSGVDNFSSDGGEEASGLKQEYTKIGSSSSSSHNNTANNNNYYIHCQRSDVDNSQNSLILNSDDNKKFSISCEGSPTSADISIPVPNSYTVRECKTENGSFNQQQNVSVQTTELVPKTKCFPIKRSSKEKEHNRKMLFKGKSLASLMHERQKISLTRERRLSRTLGIIISVFLLCWLPFFLVYILSAFIKVSQYIAEPIPTLILWLGYINSAVNPLIYTVFNVEFRTAFKRLLFPRIMNKNSSRNCTTRQSRTVTF